MMMGTMIRTVGDIIQKGGHNGGGNTEKITESVAVDHRSNGRL